MFITEDGINKINDDNKKPIRKRNCLKFTPCIFIGTYLEAKLLFTRTIDILQNEYNKQLVNTFLILASEEVSLDFDTSPSFSWLLSISRFFDLDDDVVSNL